MPDNITRIKVPMEEMKRITNKPSSTKKRLPFGFREPSSLARATGGISRYDRRVADRRIRMGTKGIPSTGDRRAKGPISGMRGRRGQGRPEYFKGLEGEKGLIESDRPRFTAGKQAATKYLPKTPAVVKTGALKSIARTAKTIGKVGARLAGPVGVALTVSDLYDTAKTVKETVGAARELGRVRAAGRAAEQGTTSIEKAMYSKYPLAGTQYEATAADKADKSVVKIPKHQRPGGTTIGGIKIGIR